MVHYANSPVLLRDVIPNIDAVTQILEDNAPYTPLGGWFRNGEVSDTPTIPMWFQNDWVQEDLAVPGSELFMRNEEVTAAARRFYDAEVVVPHTLYVNLMAAIQESGPAHTDNPRFQGRNRSNTPMWLLRSMFWSGLFDHWVIHQATSIWWMNDVEGGALHYWPDGPDKAPHEHIGNIANTALVGDNHGMFHQVGPVGPFDAGTRLVTSRAELAPTGDGSGDWAVTDLGKEHYRAPLESIRVSVLWKADIYHDEEERRRQQAELLSLEDVARIFGDDLARRGSDFRLDVERLGDMSQMRALADVYPEAKPIDAGPCVFDVYN